MAAGASHVKDYWTEGGAIVLEKFFTVGSSVTMKNSIAVSIAIIALLSGNGCRKAEFAHNAYVLADTCVVTQGRYGDSAAAGKLVFMDSVRIEETDAAIGRARVESAKGVRGWMDLIGASRVPPRWKEVPIDDFIAISLPGDLNFSRVKNDAEGADDGELTEFKFFNADYFINLVRTDEPIDGLVERAREGAGGIPREITHGGLSGYFTRGKSDMDGMPELTWYIRGDGRRTYIFHVMLQKEGGNELYRLIAAHILLSARRK